MEHEIQTIVCRILGKMPERQQDLLQAGWLDSFSFVELIEALEQGLGISIDLGQAGVENFKSVDAIVRYMTRQQG